MNIHDLYQQVTDAIVAELEHGAIPWVKNWKGEYALPTNANTTKHYNGINVAILWYEGERRGYEHQLWLTYNDARCVACLIIMLLRFDSGYPWQPEKAEALWDTSGAFPKNVPKCWCYAWCSAP